MSIGHSISNYQFHIVNFYSLEVLHQKSYFHIICSDLKITLGIRPLSLPWTGIFKSDPHELESSSGTLLYRRRKSLTSEQIDR